MGQFKRILVAALAGCLLMAFTACAPRVQTNQTATPSAGQTQNTGSDSSQEEEDTTGSDMTLADLVEEYGESWEEMGSNSLVDCEVSASGNTLIYAYTYQEQQDNTGNALGEAVSDSLEESRDTLEQQADSFAQMLGEPITIQFIYYNADGSQVTTKSFNGTP